MTDMLEYISTWSVLKWVVLVLVAGFIGQFGRMLAESIIAKVRLRRAKRNAMTDDQQKTTAVGSMETAASDSPSKPPVEPPDALLPSKPVVDMEVPDKKLLKAMAKARKKEAKKKSS